MDRAYYIVARMVSVSRGHTVALTPALMFLVGITALVPNARAAEPPAVRAYALPLADRTSVVIELPDSIARVSQEAGSGSALIVVNAGPLTTPISAQKLLPGPGLPLVAGVSAEPFMHANGEMFARVRVQLSGPSLHTLRHTGRRIYVDLVPIAPVSPIAKSPSAAPMQPTPATPLVTPLPSPAVHSSAGSPQDHTLEPIEAAYRSLELDTAARSNALANRGDVKGLIALIDSVHRRDEQLGRAQPDRVTRIIEHANRRLEEARVLLLKLEGEALRKTETSQPGRL